MNSDYDVVVVGGGPVGLAAAYEVAKAGRSVLVLERFNLFNQSGSSNDLVRMFRTMYTQDFMADLAYASMGVWRELERDAAEQLILMTGLLNFGDPEYKSGPEGTLLAPIPNLERLKMPFRRLTVDEIEAEYPFTGLPRNFEGLFAPDNGCIDVPLLLRTLHRLTTARGGRVIPHARVTGLKLASDSVTVAADVAGEALEVRAGHCIVTSGAYTNHVLASVGLQLNLDIWEMAYGYYSVDPGPEGTYFPSMWFQFQDPTGGDEAKSNLFYGFPSVPWAPPSLVRIAVDNAVNVISDPDQRKLLPSENDVEITSASVRDHCVGLDDRPNFCGTCLQTNVPDNMYVLDKLPASVGPGSEDVSVFTAGWGMKLVPLIGRVLRELALTGETEYDISQFSITREGVIR